MNCGFFIKEHSNTHVKVHHKSYTHKHVTCVLCMSVITVTWRMVGCYLA